MKPRISVLITSYNQKTFLTEAIESVLSQTLQPFEIIIVDDCSTDGSQKIIENYTRNHPDIIKAYYHKQNLGIGKNRAFAQMQAKGDWLTYLDGDDRFLPEKLEMEFKTLQQHLGGVTNLPHGPLNPEAVAHFHSGFGSNVQNNGVARDVRDQTLNGHRMLGQPGSLLL